MTEQLKNALPPEIVTRAAKAVARERGEQPCSIEWAIDHRPPWWEVAEKEAEVALTAANVPALLAENARMRAELEGRPMRRCRTVRCESATDGTHYWVCPKCLAMVERERDEARAESDLRLHQLLTCGVIATHPDPQLSRTGAYGGKWNTQQAEEVRKLRDERDEARKALAELAARFPASMADSQDGWGFCPEIREAVENARRVLGKEEVK